MFPNGVQLFKWPYCEEPTEQRVQLEMEKFGFKVYDLQTIAPWFERSPHAHDYVEIRGAVEGCTTFHFDNMPITLEPGDIIIIPGGVVHTVKTHNGRPFKAFKGSPSGERRVTEHGDGKGSLESLSQ